MDCDPFDTFCPVSNIYKKNMIYLSFLVFFIFGTERKKGTHGLKDFALFPLPPISNQPKIRLVL